MIGAIDAQRVASNQRTASMERGNDGFDQYIRGTERTQDPYWGTSEHSYANRYHWTDGQGSYQHSNDPTFDPNQGSNQSWQQMQPAR